MRNGNCKRCGHPFNPHIVAYDGADFSKVGEMRCPVENRECFVTVHFDMNDELEAERNILGE